VTTADPAPSWSAHWEESAHRQRVTVEARDYVARLRTALPIRPVDRVLDFGCGCGHAVELLAHAVAAVGYWDAAPDMLRATSYRVARFPTVFPVDLARPSPLGAFGRFDLILVNGVVQYMGRDELRRWMSRWRTLLAPAGRIVLSDIPPPDASTVGELFGLLRFAAQHRFLARAVRDGVTDAHRYSRQRGETCLTRWLPDEIVALAANNGLDAVVMPENLTHRAGRFTVVVQ
jgi:cyclopropane fatty-acyl-phospholipid synthase-like methyltransferase